MSTNSFRRIALAQGLLPEAPPPPMTPGAPQDALPAEPARPPAPWPCAADPEDQNQPA